MGRTRTKILIVDDEIQVRNAWVRLSKFAFEPIVCATGAEAKAAIRHEGDRIGAILLDVRLLGESGLDVLEEILPEIATIPCTVVSGSQDPDIPIRAEKLGARFLNKASTRSELDDHLNYAVCAWMEVPSGVRDALYRYAAHYSLRPHLTLVLGASLYIPTQKEIADFLGLPVDTVNSRVDKILELTGANTLKEAMQAVTQRIAG